MSDLKSDVFIEDTSDLGFHVSRDGRGQFLEKGERTTMFYSNPWASGPTPVARGGSGAKAPPIAVRPGFLWVFSTL